MSITYGGAVLGCANTVEDRSDALAHAGEDIQHMRADGQPLPATYIAGRVEYRVLGDGGAAGDGSTDDTAALASVLSADRRGTQTIVVLDPRKTYRYSSSDLALSANTHLLGYGAILKPLSVENTRLSLQDRCSVLGLNLHGVEDSHSRRRERFDNGNSLGSMYGTVGSGADTSNASAWIHINGRQDCVVADVHCRGSLVGLIRAFGVTDCMIERVSAFRTHAAAIRLEDESTFCTIRQVDVQSTGDAAVAVVQGSAAPGQPRNLLLEDIRAKYVVGNGVSIISARDVLLRRGWFEDAALAGVRIGPEDGHSAAGTSVIDVVDTEAWRCARLNADPKENGLFAALVSSSSYTCTGITFTRCFGAAYKDRYGGGSIGNLVRTTNGGAGVPSFTTTDCDTEELVPGD